MPKGQLITLKDIMAMEGLTEKSASRRKRQILDSIGKTSPGAELLVAEYCKYIDITTADFYLYTTPQKAN